MIDVLKEWLGLTPETAKVDPGDDDALPLAVAALLVEMSRADHEQTEEEREVALQALEQHLALPMDQARALLDRAHAEATEAVSLYDFTRALNSSLDDDGRVEVLKLLWRVAVADGAIDKYEEHLVRKVADLLYVPHAGYIRAKLAVLDSGDD